MRELELGGGAPGVIKHDAPGRYYLPNPLPPAEFALESVTESLQDATYELGRLAATSQQLSVSPLALTTLQRHEASASTRIEGADMTLEEVYRQEASDQAVDEQTKKDLQEVLNYETALNLGVDHLESGGTLTLTFLRSIHETLLSDVPRGQGPVGTFRDSMVYPRSPNPGSEVFVPPAPKHLDDLMADLEQYLHAKQYPTLVDAALLHYQLETIHPFADGNGRLGRVLVPLQFIDADLLPAPYLYLSSFFERRQGEYVRLLRRVSVEGAWESWVRFFLTAVAKQARVATQTLERLADVHARYHNKYDGTRAADRLARHLFDEPYVDAQVVATQLGVSAQTAYNALDALVEDGVLEEVTGNDRGREYIAAEIFAALREADSETSQ